MIKKTIVVDIDGTIAKMGDRLKYILQKPRDYDSFYAKCLEDEPIHPIIELVKSMYLSGFEIVFCTGRIDSVRKESTKWISKHLPFLKDDIKIIMRKSGDKRPDTEVKPEILSEAGYDTEKVLFILEDRTCVVDMWRKLGYTCLQTVDGKY